jgi:paraquat-inducible protein A
MTPSTITAKSTALISCHCCHLLCRPRTSSGNRRMQCPRCGAGLHQRKPRSLTRTWALLVAAAICYVPANVLPATRAISFGKVQTDTIMSGVIYFINTGMWPIALIIFIASICVPLVKLIILSFLLISVHRRSAWRPKERARFYRITEAVGRWSMVDIYVITISVALVKLGAVARFEAGPGIVFFAAVVVLTMLAAMSFDPRLIWDNKESRNDRTENRTAPD